METIARLPAAIRGSRPFVLLLLMDADEVYSGEIELVAAQLLNKGLAYFGVWGPECIRVREVFERSMERLEDAVEHELPQVSCVSHEDDNVQDTVWEFLNIYWPGEEFENPRWIAAVVKDKKLAARVQALLADTERV